MEAGESGTNKQSGHSISASNAHPHLNPASESPSQSQPHRPLFDQGPREHHSMATAALISPTTPYPPHPHSHSHPHSQHQPQRPPLQQHHSMPGPPFSFPPSAGFASSGPSSASIPGMLSPTETRRSSDDHDMPPQPHRQSLPSITEVIGPKIPGGMPPGPPTSLPPAPSLPSPFSTTTPTRPFPPEMGGERHPSPRTLQPMTTGFPRPDSLPAFSDPARPARSGGPPPLSNIAGPAPHESSPPLSADHPRHHHDTPRLGEPGHMNGSYGHPSQPPPYPPQSGPLPPGQLPLGGPYPISPRHVQPPLPSPFDAQRPPLHPDDPRAKYEHTIHRQFEAWSYGEHLAKIGSGSRTLYNFAESYQNLAQEEHSAQPIPGRLPSEREVSEMISLTDHLHTLCENVRNIVQQSIMQERASREGNKARGFEDDDVAMYDGMKAPYGVPDVKKRRGRAAPPGRCHSCNRIDTPEWRRGPDGARTLCNACGLHYAKLERKRQSEHKRSKIQAVDTPGYGGYDPRNSDRASGGPREDDAMSGTESRP